MYMTAPSGVLDFYVIGINQSPHGTPSRCCFYMFLLCQSNLLIKNLDNITFKHVGGAMRGAGLIKNLVDKRNDKHNLTNSI